ncbi:4-oxalocrotonate tautomerase family protein [Synechococcus sp. Lug-A]|uniref:tautomerase family protein n=1 Tax=Synechococcus sp. Lug-A TaxID=2823740 RepID=UPI0020CD6984|nr:4-oxalocrotonate tautomerase family protein [Synechococcus sp. Lug-A]
MGRNAPTDFHLKPRATMPYVHIQITREGATAEQKAELIRGATELLVRVLNKDPATTFVVIEEVDTDNWGVGGESVTTLRRRAKEEAT